MSKNLLPNSEAGLISAVEVSNGRTSSAAAPTTSRILLRRCATYPEAQKIVDQLSDREFPVEHTAIVARNLSFVEEVTGKLTWWSVAMRGTGLGSFGGFFIGLILGLFVVESVEWLVLLGWTMLVGAVVGDLFSSIGYWSMGGRRDFETLGSVVAETYDVLVHESYKAKADELLAKS